MRSNKVYSSRLVFLVLIGLVRLSVCTTIRYDQIYRDVPANRDIVQQHAGTWKNPTVSQSIAPTSDSNAESLTLHASNNNKLQFNDRISDFIADNVMRFAINVGQQLGENTHISKSEVFSPLSVMSALALLMLGAKGRSYQELKDVFGIDYDAELLNKPSKFHEEFGLLLEDLQTHDQQLLRPRTNANWRNTTVSNSIRNVEDSRLPADQITKVANGIFIQHGHSLNPDYQYTVKSIYRSELTPLDFNGKPADSRDFINSWVERKTFGKIPNIINGNIARGTNVIIASALYFKAFWENTFFESATITDNFYPDGAHMPPVKVKMMATGGVFPFYDSSEYNCRIIGLPYKGNETTMYVIQPNQSTRTKLKDLQHLLDARKIEELISKMVKKSAILAFPKMHIVRNINMRDILYSLGIKDIFSNGLSDLSLIAGVGSPTYAPVPAQAIEPLGPSRPQFSTVDRYYEAPLIFKRFGENDNNTNTSTENPLAGQIKGGSKIKRQAHDKPLLYRESLTKLHLERLEAERLNVGNQNTDLFVEDIVHKIDFDVNEHGTEAAAATVTYLRRSGTDVLFRADSPFLILIRHDPTKLVLFYGIINEPEL